MKRLLVSTVGAGIALSAFAMSVGAQDGCGGAAEGVDLAVQSARLRQRDDGWVVLYTVTNRGHLASTSYSVSLIMDGAEVGAGDEYVVGLEAGRRRRWELALPEDMASPVGHELAVHVTTAARDSAAGPSYADQCSLNDELQVSVSAPSRNGADGPDSYGY